MLTTQGTKNDRRSTSSFQIFVDGNLVESRVRAQKAIALSSGESEFVAIVAGCSEGLLGEAFVEQVDRTIMRDEGKI